MAQVSFQFYFLWIHSSIFSVPSLALKTIFPNRLIQIRSRSGVVGQNEPWTKTKSDSTVRTKMDKICPTTSDSVMKWKSYQAHFLFRVWYQDFWHRHALQVWKLLDEIKNQESIKPEFITIFITKFELESFISATSG